MERIPEKIKYRYYLGKLSDEELKDILSNRGYEGGQLDWAFLMMKKKRQRIRLGKGGWS